MGLIFPLVAGLAWGVFRVVIIDGPGFRAIGPEGEIRATDFLGGGLLIFSFSLLSQPFNLILINAGAAGATGEEAPGIADAFFSKFSTEAALGDF